MEEQPKYGIFRIEKIKLCDGGEIMGRLKHAFREFKNDSFDPELTKLNKTFILGSAKEVMKAYKDRINEITTDKYKPPKNAVGIYECMFTSTAGAIPKERENEFFELTYEQLCKTFGKENVLAGTVHVDETTVHTHWFVLPIFNTTSMLRRTRKEKEKGIFRTISQLQLNASHWTGSPALLSKLQDIMWEGVFKHFGLERGEVELTGDRTKKKKNKRSELKKRDETLSEKEKELEREQERQKEKALELSKTEEKQKENEAALKNERQALSEEKADFEKHVTTAAQEAVNMYDSLKRSDEFENADFPSLPAPDSNENSLLYHFRIKPVFDAVVSKAKQFFSQIKLLKKSHKEEIEKLSNEHERNLQVAKQNAEIEKQNAVAAAVKKKADEMTSAINLLKQDIQKEQKEKEKWHTMLFKKFTCLVNGKPVEVNHGLTDAYLKTNQQLSEWEGKSGDELIDLGNNYKKFNVKCWRDYIKAKFRNKENNYDMAR